MRVIIRSKDGCIFCDKLKQALTELNVRYEEEVIYSGVAPVMVVDGIEVFVGLPKYQELIKYCDEKGLNNVSK